MVIRCIFNINNILSTTKRFTFTTMRNIRTFVFFDLETTGLPSQEFNKTRVVELCFISIQADHLRLGTFPRVQNKLTMCVNPRKIISTGASEITGLSNSLLEYQYHFDYDTVEMINRFLNHNPKPLCLVAHNGNKFDFPILRSEIINAGGELDGDLLCIDSLTAFKDLELDSCYNQQQTSDVPFEFSDDYDQILFEAAEEMEINLERARVISKIKKTNETTPPKQKTANVNNRVRRNLNFGMSYKLSDIYKRLTNNCPKNAHEADSDTNMLIMCAATLGERFVEWSNSHARKLCDIPPMVPGRKLGF